jgi:tRNA pseudouridine38-40 synthase
MGLNRYVLWLEYKGTGFGGFQRLTSRDTPPPRHKGSPRKWPRARSLQEEIEGKLALVLRHPVHIFQAGRTDQGVHATEQVVAFDTGQGLDSERFVRRMNEVLHADLRVIRMEPARADFHPRFRAQRRRYQYLIWPAAAATSSPFWGELCWLLPDALALPPMRQAAVRLLGSHDFSAYGRAPDDSGPTVRELFRLDVLANVVASPLEEGPLAQLTSLVCIEVEANAFLRRMVRQLVGNLVQVGLGRWSVERPYEVLLSRDLTLSAPPAPPQGLYLTAVDYPEECWRRA